MFECVGCGATFSAMMGDNELIKCPYCNGQLKELEDERVNYKFVVYPHSWNEVELIREALESLKTDFWEGS